MRPNVPCDGSICFDGGKRDLMRSGPTGTQMMLTPRPPAASMRDMRYRVTTLGCRVNHAETRELESLLQARGLVRAVDGVPADLEVIHTCSVTGAAAAKSRQAIRRALRRQGRSDWSQDQDVHEVVPAVGPSRTSPGTPAFSISPQVIVSGCFGTTDPEEAARLAGGQDQVIRHESDDGATLARRFAHRVDQWLESLRAHPSLRRPEPASCRQSARRLPVVTPHRWAGSHVRAELKIQDGCDAYCTFCIIPRIRRTLRSKTIPDAVREARQLVELGHREIVLTGIFIGAYGHETALRRRQPTTGAETTGKGEEGGGARHS